MTHRLPCVSFFCPAYFDEENIIFVVHDVLQFLPTITDTFEIIIVNDGSPDQTGTVADALSREHSAVRVIHHATNRGYGSALSSGFAAARYDYIMYTDGDHQYDILDFTHAIPFLMHHDVVAGYVTIKAVTPLRRFQSAVFNRCVDILFGTHFKDINCSMKIYKKHVLDTVFPRSSSAFIDAEMMIRARRAGFSIAQFPVTHRPRAHGRASGSRPSVIWDTIKDMTLFRLSLL